MSTAATEQQNNGDVAVEKIAAADATDAVKEEKQKKPSLEEKADNGTEKEKDVAVAVTKEQVKGTKRPAEEKSADTKKAKKEKAAAAAAAANSDCSDDEEIIEEIEEDSEIESDEYDMPYDEDDVECDDDDDDDDDDNDNDNADLV